MGLYRAFGGIFREQTPRVLLPRNYPPHFEGEWHDLSWACKVSPLATKASASARAEAASRSIHTRTDDFLTNIQLVKRKCFNKKSVPCAARKKWPKVTETYLNHSSLEITVMSQLLESTQVNELRMTIFCCGNIKSKTKKNNLWVYRPFSSSPPIFTARPGGRPPLPGEEVGSGDNNLQQRFVNERGVSFPTKHVSCHDVFAPPLCTHKFGLNRWNSQLTTFFREDALARRNLIEKQTVQG